MHLTIVQIINLIFASCELILSMLIMMGLLFLSITCPMTTLLIISLVSTIIIIIGLCKIIYDYYKIYKM
jgi:hypothetical protein